MRCNRKVRPNMQNPSYLIRSRHAIYYFRYPVANHSDGKVSVSLNTRCPKEALRLSKILEYHALMVMSNQDVQTLDYIEVKEILRNHFAEVVERWKRSIDRNGALSGEKLDAFKNTQTMALEAIEDGRDEIYCEDIDDEDEDYAYSLSIDSALKPIVEKYKVFANKDGKEYVTLRREYKYAYSSYIAEVLAYSNGGASFYDYAPPSPKAGVRPTNQGELKLSAIIQAYLKEYKGDKEARGYKDKCDCIDYLVEVFGKDFLITDIDYPQMRKVKDMLINTPTNRNKVPQTRGLPLVKQIEAQSEYGLDVLADRSVNKYLGYISALFKWAKQNKYISENPFDGVKVEVDKKKAKRKHFSDDEVSQVLDALSSMDTSKGLGKARYWSALIYVYTGARLNEIASLTPDDVIEGKETGIWYFNITDEEESKKVKTEAGTRFVPVHSKLIELGFLRYVEHAREVIAKSPKTDGYPTRLLYALTYKDGVWGRKIGRWFNDTFLPDLGLKEGKVSLHSLRHSFITSLSIAGVEASTIMALAGHEQGTVTFGVYAHYDVKYLPVFKEAIEKIEY